MQCTWTPSTTGMLYSALYTCNLMSVSAVVSYFGWFTQLFLSHIDNWITLGSIRVTEAIYVLWMHSYNVYFKYFISTQVTIAYRSPKMLVTPKLPGFYILEGLDKTTSEGLPGHTIVKIIKCFIKYEMKCKIYNNQWITVVTYRNVCINILMIWILFLVENRMQLDNPEYNILLQNDNTRIIFIIYEIYMNVICYKSRELNSASHSHLRFHNSDIQPIYEVLHNIEEDIEFCFPAHKLCAASAHQLLAVYFPSAMAKGYIMNRKLL